MSKQKNIVVVASLKEKLARAKSLVLADYTGLTHKQSEELHKKVKAVGGEFLVVKNSLLKIASEKKTDCKGPSAVLLAYDEELSPLKELYKFIKTTTLPKIKMGIINNVTYDEVAVTRLATLPDRQTLYGQFAYTLNGNLQKLAYALSKIQIPIPINTNSQSTNDQN